MLAVLDRLTLWPAPWSWMSALLGPGESSRSPNRVPSHAKVEPPPDEFVARLHRKEERALRELFDRHHKSVERVLIRVLGPDPDLTDVVQDTFERALGSLHRFAGTADKLGPWLRKISIHVAKNRLRHQRVRRWIRGAVPYEMSEVAGRVASPEIVDAMRRTYDVLDGLPADERVAFALRFIDGMELTEIAETTGASLATVKRRLKRARQRFERRAANDLVLREWQTGRNA